MAAAGYAVIILVFVVSLYTAVMAALGARRAHAFLQSAQNGALAAVVLSTVAVGLLLALLLGRDFGVQYVYEHTNAHLSIPYTISALWAGQEGSLLLWLWFLSLLVGSLVRRQRKEGAASGSYALAVLAGTQAFLAFVLVTASNPFAQLPVAAVEGRGLNPLLQNVWMVAHPPVVFMGYAAYTLPFALSVGALITGQFTREWLSRVRRWSLYAWLFLGAGILMGAWWAYLELGWGGYWGWDPVENSSLIPWLTGTALLHSLMMQERRGTFRRWNLWLAALTFTLCLFATFVTRSGLIQSVHAFGRSALGYYFLAFILLALALVAYLLHRRREQLTESQELGTFASREASLLLTNLLFVGAAGLILMGILFPNLVGALQGRQASLDAAFYERTVGPVAQAIVLLIGICPWLRWGGSAPTKTARQLGLASLVAVAAAVALFLFGVRHGLALLAFAIAAFVLVSIIASIYGDVAARRRSQGENPLAALLALLSRSHRRYGGRLVHLGVVLIAIGVVGSSIYQDEVQVSLAQGEEVAFRGYTVRYRQAFIEENALYRRVGAEIDVLRGNTEIAALQPKKDFYWSTEQWVTEVAIRSTPKDDLYVILAGLETDGLASFRLLLNPLVMWLWIGGALLLLGGVMAWWPTGHEEREP